MDPPPRVRRMTSTPATRLELLQGGRKARGRGGTLHEGRRHDQVEPGPAAAKDGEHIAQGRALERSDYAHAPGKGRDGAPSIGIGEPLGRQAPLGLLESHLKRPKARGLQDGGVELEISRGFVYRELAPGQDHHSIVGLEAEALGACPPHDGFQRPPVVLQGEVAVARGRRVSSWRFRPPPTRPERPPPVRRPVTARVPKPHTRAVRPIPSAWMKFSRKGPAGAGSRERGARWTCHCSESDLMARSPRSASRSSRWHLHCHCEGAERPRQSRCSNSARRDCFLALNRFASRLARLASCVSLNRAFSLFTFHSSLSHSSLFTPHSSEVSLPPRGQNDHHRTHDPGDAREALRALPHGSAPGGRHFGHGALPQLREHGGVPSRGRAGARLRGRQPHTGDAGIPRSISGFLRAGWESTPTGPT